MSEPSSFAQKRRQLVKDLGGAALIQLERLIETASTVPTTPFLPADTFAWTARLEAGHPAIRAEVEALLEHRDLIPNFQDISTDQVALTTDAGWKTYFLFGMGYKAEQNCARCPETTRLLETVPGMTTAFFSILSPRKHIPEHRGLYKGFVRYHLGLVVPEPAEACRIRVADETRHWREGESMLFDDTYPHEVWNDTDGVRVVLFLDIKRPLSFPVNLVNEGVIRAVRMSDYVQDAKRNQEEWQGRIPA